MKKLRLLFILLFSFTITIIPSIAFAAETAKSNTDPIKIWIVIGVLVLAAVLFLTEAIPLVATSMLVPFLLVVLQVIPFSDAFSGFSDKWVLLFLFMFIIGDSLFQVGVADKIGQSIIKFAKNNETRLVVYVMLVSGIMSAFLSNTGTAACLLPIMIAISKSSGISIRKLLIPMAFATSLGGSLTLIGTPPNGIVQSAYESFGGNTFSFFDYGKVSIFIFVVGIIFIATYGKKVLAKLDTTKTEKVESSPEHISIKYDKKKAPIAITVFTLVILFMVMGPLWKNIFPPVAGYFKSVPLTAYAIIGAVVILATRVVTVKQAFKAVDWTTIFLFAGMLSMKPALINTGAAKFIGDAMIHASYSVSINPNYAILIALILISVIVTNFMSNTATAALFAPIALEVGILLHCNPAPLLIGVGLACSVCFLTPVATPPNTLILGPGKYSFMDYIKAGWLLQLIVVIMLIILIPIFFPF
ncbi:MAG: SLC13/DASS family transporter [Caldisericia bacterium]|nr:SLC13/DASS family transporter [Caldisericia bacterium]